MEKKRLRHQELVALLSSTIATVCRSYLTFEDQLELEGLLGVTIDTERLVLVNIRETLRQWDKSDEPVDLTVGKSKAHETKSHSAHKHLQSTIADVAHPKHLSGCHESHAGKQKESSDLSLLCVRHNESCDSNQSESSSDGENLGSYSVSAELYDGALKTGSQLRGSGNIAALDTEIMAVGSCDSVRSEGSFMHELVNNILTADNLARDEHSVTVEQQGKCTDLDPKNFDQVELDINSNSKGAQLDESQAQTADECMSKCTEDSEIVDDVNVELSVMNTDSEGNVTLIVSKRQHEEVSADENELSQVPKIECENVDSTTVVIQSLQSKSAVDNNVGCDNEITGRMKKTNDQNDASCEVKSELKLPIMTDHVNTWMENNVPSFESNTETSEGMDVESGEGDLDDSQTGAECSSGGTAKKRPKVECSGSEGLPDVMEAALSAAGVSMTTYEPEMYRDPSSGKVRKQFRCPACPKIMQSMWKLRRHLSSHTGVKPFRCEICSKEFVESGLLTRHLRTHSGEKPFRCSVCCQVFTDSGNLRKHRRLHRGAAPHECYMCGETFHELNDLYSHMGSHSGLRPFECAHCGKNFTQPGHLSIHRLHCKTKT